MTGRRATRWIQLLTLMFLSECTAFNLVPQPMPQVQQMRPWNTMASPFSCHQRSALGTSPSTMVSANTRLHGRGGCHLQSQVPNSDMDDAYSNSDRAAPSDELTSDEVTKTSESLHLSRKLFHTCDPPPVHPNVSKTKLRVAMGAKTQHHARTHRMRIWKRLLDHHRSQCNDHARF